jgi:hypothetical protein
MSYHQAKSLIIDHVITTVSRPKNYIDELLRGLQVEGAIRLVVGSPDCEYLERYRSSPLIEIIGVSSPDWAHFQNSSVHHRVVWNHWRSLTLGPKSLQRDGVLVFEDDVILARGWQRRFYDTVEQIEARFGTRYVLALYRGRFLQSRTFYNWFRRTLSDCLYPEEQRGYYATYPVRQFWGTQAMYYPEEIRKDFAEYVKINGVNAYRRPYDLLLKDYLQTYEIPVFTTVPSLVQHIGEIGTGVGWKFHTARKFEKNLESVGLHKRVLSWITQSKPGFH